MKEKTHGQHKTYPKQVKPKNTVKEFTRPTQNKFNLRIPSKNLFISHTFFNLKLI